MVNTVNFKAMTETISASNSKSSTQKKENTFKDLMDKKSENSKKDNVKNEDKSDKTTQTDSSQSKPKAENTKENTKVEEDTNQLSKAIASPDILAMLFQAQQLQNTQQQLPQVQEQIDGKLNVSNESQLVSIVSMGNGAIPGETLNQSAQNQVIVSPLSNTQEQIQTTPEKVETPNHLAENTSIQESIQTQLKANQLSNENLHKNVTNSEIGTQMQKGETPAVQTQQLAQQQSFTQEDSHFEKSQENADLLAASKQTPLLKEEVVQIKVGEGDMIEPESLKTQISEKIQDMVVKATGTNNEFEIQLAPEHLGKILVKIAFKDGETSVSLICSNPKTMSILAENARSINEIVQANTNTHVTINVQEENKSFYDEQSNQQQRGQENQQRENQQSKQQNASIDFMQQMRLGLIDIGN